MTVSFTFEGNHYPISKIIMPYHSMNETLKNDNPDEYGFPVRTSLEIYGLTGIGKSTVTTDIATHISKALDNRPISYLDLEGQDENVITRVLRNAGYAAETLKWVGVGAKEKPTDEKLLGKLLDDLLEGNIGILDSVAEISPVAEVEGDIGDANMGRRAFPMAQFSRQVTRALRMMETPSVLFMINHLYEKMATGGNAKVYTSPGGVVKDNLCKLRIEMRVPWVQYLSAGESKTEGRWNEFGAWILEGKVNKNRSGAKNEVFQVFVYGGHGVHIGMSAVIDCLASGLAVMKSGGKLTMNGIDYGLLSKVIGAKKDDKEFFTPFVNALNGEIDTVSSQGEK